MAALRDNHLYRDIDSVVVPSRRIARRVGELAGEISRCYRGGDLSILAVLSGSLIFLADLMRKLPLKMRLELVSVCSYPAEAIRSTGARLTVPLPASLKGRDVLIVDDILDSGRTLSTLLAAVKARRPASVRSCVLLRKARPDVTGRVEADFVGFDVPDQFVVGYGLDHDNLYRNLPDICVLKLHAPRAVVAWHGRPARGVQGRDGPGTHGQDARATTAAPRRKRGRA